MDQNLRQSANLFLTQLFLEMETAGLSLKPKWEIDHLCYRVETLDRYNEMKLSFAKQGTLLAETLVAGRPIATYKLKQPLRFDSQKRIYEIPLVELPAPKKGKIVQEGFEHFEVVCDCSFEELMSSHPKLIFDTSGLSKVLNQELETRFSSGAVKFHHQSLEKVIELERSLE